VGTAVNKEVVFSATNLKEVVIGCLGQNRAARWIALGSVVQFLEEELGAPLADVLLMQYSPVV